MSDAKFFSRGKVDELRTELNSDKKDPKFTKKKAALKRIVANMTMGNDMAALFPDVLSCMQIPVLEIKKMVYLFLVNYAKSAPDLVIMADATDPNPLIRSLAIRTMSYIQVDKIQQCLCEPLRQAFKDSDPYVRKTAAMTVAKMQMTNPQLVEMEGFMSSLVDLLSDNNPMVVANACVSVVELFDRDPSHPHAFDITTVNKMLVALNECNEWCSTYILEGLMYFVPKESGDAEMIAERITSRLQHANSGVVLATVKVILYMINFIAKPKTVEELLFKLSPPLVTLLHKEPEIQYVALRNILLILQKYPDLLKNDLKVFYCKYNDPIYVKLSKLEVMMRVTDESNVDQCLSELKEYSSEVDVDFVRKSVRSIGLCAVKIEKAAEKCVAALVELIETKVNYVVQEAIVVIKDIFRKYPNRYESIISVLCDNLDNLDEPSAKASMIWIIGHYSDRIVNAGELLEDFVESFSDEPDQVHLALLTATVKLFIRRPSAAKDLVQKVLKLVTDLDNPDVRDRGYIYWRLLSVDPNAAKAIIFSDRPAISAGADNLDSGLLQELMVHINSLASIYHRPPMALFQGFARRFVPGNTIIIGTDHPHPSSTDVNPYALSEIETTKKNINLLDLDDEPPAIINPFGALPVRLPDHALSDKSESPVMPLDLSPIMSPNIFGETQGYQQPPQTFLVAQQSKGLQVSGSFVRKQGRLFLELKLNNRALEPLSDFAIQFNKNSFGLRTAGPLSILAIPPSQSYDTLIPLALDGPVQAMTPINNLQVALKNNVGINYFQTLLPLFVFFCEDGLLEKSNFLNIWKDIPDTQDFSFDVPNQPVFNGAHQQIVNATRMKLHKNNVFMVAERQVDKTMMYYSIKLHNNMIFLVEIVVNQGQCRATIKTFAVQLAQAIRDSLLMILTSPL